MHGNVAEWVEDLYHSTYVDAPTDDSAWGSEGDAFVRVARGGAWEEPKNIRSARRSGLNSSKRVVRVGFRVARDL
jgi:formylglycine-generating enzyme required for sulfatase activity